MYEEIEYYHRKISSFCKEHRCATCPYHTSEGCSFLRNSPFKEDKTNENNDQDTV